jgi:phosphatidylserine decarboxylase
MGNIRLWVAKEGVPFILLAALPALVAWILDGVTLAVFLTLLTLWVVWFFRDPERVPPPGEHRVVSPADGKVIDIQRLCEREFIGDKGTKISIFMNVFNVHVNRIPLSGKIAHISYRPGKFFSANLDKASQENERNALILETPAGQKVLFIQIAGLVARRIACRVNEGDRVERGERFGMIRFGSRVDVFLPESAEVLVHLGDHVKAGESVLGELKTEKRETIKS